MNVGLHQRTRRREGLLAVHLESLDPDAVQARDRLEAALGSELAHKLVFALAPHRPVRRAA